MKIRRKLSELLVTKPSINSKRVTKPSIKSLKIIMINQRLTTMKAMSATTNDFQLTKTNY